MPPVNSTVVTIPLASDHLTPADILSDLSISGFPKSVVTNARSKSTGLIPSGFDEGEVSEEDD